MADYFISYSTKDRNFVERLFNELEANGFDAWMDKDDLQGGDVWKRKVTKSIRECVAVILVISPRSMQSEDVEREVDIAEREKKTIIPIVYENARLSDSLEYSIGNIQRIDFQNSFQDGFNRLVKVLSSRSPQRSGTRQQPSLAGRWQVQVTYMDGNHGTVIFDFHPNGTFQAKEWHPPMPPNMRRSIQGSWIFNSPNRLTVDGIENQMGRDWGTQVVFGTVQEDFLEGRSNVWIQSEWKRIG